MANTTTTSSQFSLKWFDVFKGLAVAVLTPIFTIIITSVNNGELTFNWKAMGLTGLSAGLAYLLKNFLSPPQIIIKDSETVKAVKDGEAEVKVINK